MYPMRLCNQNPVPDPTLLQKPSQESEKGFFYTVKKSRARANIQKEIRRKREEKNLLQFLFVYII